MVLCGVCCLICPRRDDRLLYTSLYDIPLQSQANGALYVTFIARDALPCTEWRSA